MASPFSHAVAAVALGAAFEMPLDACLLGAAAAISPDIDVFLMPFGIADDSLLGHRMFTHSLTFALIVAAAVLFARIDRYMPLVRRRTLGLYLFLAIASHGIIDAFTDAGFGVAFFAPFSRARYLFPLHLLRVSPVVARTPFTPEAIEITRSELVWICLPSILFISAAVLRRRAEAPAA